MKYPKLTIRSGIAGLAALMLLICLGVYIEVKDAMRFDTVQPTPFLEDRNGSYLAEGWGDDKFFSVFFISVIPAEAGIRNLGLIELWR